MTRAGEKEKKATPIKDFQDTNTRYDVTITDHSVTLRHPSYIERCDPAAVDFLEWRPFKLYFFRT